MRVGRSCACDAYRPAHHPAARFSSERVVVVGADMSIWTKKKLGDVA
ncbi:hypothetical protein SAMN04488078_102714 [Antarctobacter heliothermus]|uniref:Uncharacterized protein n=1 Tax=Antarctobacter heliothermus TaxID=74033 RepID=A0A239GK27_9RHOB|nr:hypothetical protein SAMN04488078_102714 [Antarctobacter heliothermus]